MAKILTVDDSVLICQIVKNTLFDECETLLFASEGEEALCVAQKELPDLILLNVVMKDMDGFELCLILKSNTATSGIPVVFITSRTTPEDTLKGFQCGAVDFITKPFSAVELKARVRTQLKNKLMVDDLKLLNAHLAKALEENCRLATQDPLTTLYNRRYMLELLEKEASKREKGKNCALLMVDIDFFKLINDNYGHDTGDYVICTVADIIKKVVEKKGSVCRWGGEEFLIYLKDVSEEDIGFLGFRICKEVAQYDFLFKGKMFSCHVTVGGVPLRFLKPIDYYISGADQALYDGKENGKNTFVYADISDSL